MDEQTQPSKKPTWADIAGPEESAPGTSAALLPSSASSPAQPPPDTPESPATNEEDPGALDYAVDMAKGAWNGVVGAVEETNQFLWDVAGLPEQAFKDINPDLAKVAGAVNPLGAVRRAHIALGWGTEDQASGTEFAGSLKMHTETMAGAVTQNVVNLGLGIVGAGKLLKAGKVLQGAGKAAGLFRGAVSGAIADATVMDPLEERLSNLIQSVPWMENAFSEALAAKPGDSRWAGRFKNAAEGLLLGVPADLIIDRVLLPGVKALRGIKHGDEKLLAEGLTELEDGLAKAQAKEGGGDAAALAEAKVQGNGEVREGINSAVESSQPSGPQLRPEAPTLDVDKVVEHIKANSKTPEELLERQREVLNQHRLSITDEFGLKLHEAVNNIAFERTKLAKGTKSLAEITGSAEEWKTRGFYGADVDELLTTASGKGATAEEATKAAYTMRSMYKAIHDELAPLTERLMTVGGSETDVARQQLLLLMQGKLTVGIRDFGTNSARALGSLRELARPFAEALRQGDPRAITKAGDKLVKQGVMKSPDEWITMLKKGNAAEIIGNPRAVRDLAQAITAKRGSDYLLEVYMNNILGGIRTHLTNTAGNAIKSFLTPAMRFGGRLIPGKAFSPSEAIQELKTYTAFKHQIGASARFAWRAFKEDRSLLDAGGTAWTEGGGATRAWSKENVRGRWVRKQLENGKSLNDVLDNVPTGVELFAATVDKIGAFINLPSRFLRMEDEFFKQLAYRSQMEADFTAEAVTRFGKENSQAINEHVAGQMEDIFDSAGRAVDKNALEHARRMTWSQELRPNSPSRRLQDFTNSHPVLKAVVPFVRTPTNLFVDSLEHIPIVRSLSADFRAAKKEGGRAYAEMQGKAAFGSLLIASTALMANEGLITGSGPSDPKYREALMRESGWRPNSIKIGDTYISYNRMDPLATLLTATANLVDAAPLMSAEHMGELQSTLLASTFRLIGDKSYMQSVGDLMDLMNGDERARGRFFDRLATGLTTPNYVREARGVYDEVLRDTHTTWSRVKDGIPGFSSTLPARYDWLTGAPILGGLSNLVGISSINEDAVTREVAVLGGLFKTPPYKFNGVELTEAEHSRYCELIGTIKLDGKTLHQALNTAIHSSEYDLERKHSADDDARAKYLNRIISTYRKVAGYHLQQESSRLPQDAAEAEEHKENIPRLTYGGPKAGGAPSTAPQQRNAEELRRFAFPE